MNRPTALLPRLMLVPLLGATESLVSALGLWLMFVTVVNLFGLALSPVRLRLTAAAQMPASILLAAALTSCAELTAQAWALQWQQYVGLYGALIALVCVVLEHTGHFYSAWLERLRQYCVFGALMVCLGLLRELIGNGTLGNHLSWLAGTTQTDWPGWILFAGSGLHVATLAPGGLILLGLLIAAWQAWRPTPRTPTAFEETRRK